MEIIAKDSGTCAAMVAGTGRSALVSVGSDERWLLRPKKPFLNAQADLLQNAATFAP